MKKLSLLMILSASAMLLGACGSSDNDSTSSTTSAATSETISVSTSSENVSASGEDVSSIVVTSDETTSENKPVYEQGDKKGALGTGLMFEETIGFNTKDASIFEENGERYVVYASQEVSKGQQVFAARKAIKVDNKWVYGEKHIVLKGDSESWDSYIFQPSVVKGAFTYNGQNYAYLMAYQGNEDGSNFNNHIGLAVSNNVLGDWVRVGSSPVIENPEIYESCYGFGSPSLASINNAGKVLLTYSFGETAISGARVKEIDASNLDDVKVEKGYAELPCTGLTGRDDSVLSNCSIALGKQSKKVFLANDGMPSYNAPGNASSFEVAKAEVSILSDANASWTSLKRVTGFDTMDINDDNSLGWDELYSATFVTDAYGYVDETADKLEVVYSTFNEGVQDALYTAQLATFEVSLNA